jgi:hypothetical protein
VEDNRRKENVQAPQARKKIARSFNCGFEVEKRKAPEGRQIFWHYTILSPLPGLGLF